MFQYYRFTLTSCLIITIQVFPLGVEALYITGNIGEHHGLMTSSLLPFLFEGYISKAISDPYLELVTVSLDIIIEMKVFLTTYCFY